jgi:hypothetical protein
MLRILWAPNSIPICIQQDATLHSLFIWQIPDAVNTVVCAPDDGWKYHPKHVEQFPVINKLCNVAFFGYILEYTYDARIHKR